MKTLRKLRNQAPKHMVRPRREFDVSDATMEATAEPAPEAVFDRITGPYGRRASSAPALFGGFDEET